jgi:hypothetical protein
MVAAMLRSAKDRAVIRQYSYHHGPTTASLVQRRGSPNSTTRLVHHQDSWTLWNHTAGETPRIIASRENAWSLQGLASRIRGQS